MSLAIASELLDRFGESIGIPNLRFDDKRSCCLVFDNRILTSIAYEERLERLVLFSHLGQLPPAAGRHHMVMLEGNFFWQGTDGATLGVEPGSRSAVLMKALPLAGLDSATFHAVIESFVNTAGHWIGRLSILAESDEGFADRPGPLPASLGMRV